VPLGAYVRDIERVAINPDLSAAVAGDMADELGVVRRWHCVPPVMVSIYTHETSV